MSDLNKPYIFLDIDGTLSSQIHTIDDAVVKYLLKLVSKGFILTFVTGRSYNWAKKTLSFLTAPYILAVQNGAIIASMPQGNIIKKSYFHKDFLKEIDALVSASYVIYTGEENNFCCYYLKTGFTSVEKERLLSRAEKIGEVWVELDSFEELPINTFPAIKFFGEAKDLDLISESLAKALKIFIPVILDPVVAGRAVAQGTLTNKGDVVDFITEMYGEKPVISAGDDMNDFEMLMKADIKVVIDTAPKKIMEIADIVCSKDIGIIEGLRKAIEKVSNNGELSVFSKDGYSLELFKDTSLRLEHEWRQFHLVRAFFGGNSFSVQGREHASAIFYEDDSKAEVTFTYARLEQDPALLVGFYIDRSDLIDFRINGKKGLSFGLGDQITFNGPQFEVSLKFTQVSGKARVTGYLIPCNRPGKEEGAPLGSDWAVFLRPIAVEEEASYKMSIRISS